LASGLALPEVVIDLDLASSLVDQAVRLSESIVRKRVDQKFCKLRFRVIEDCLAPFCRNALRGGSAEEVNGEGANHREGNHVGRIVQMASVALSDSLQLVDDTVRSILSNLSNDSSSEEAPMLKAAVVQSTTRFAIWLAAAMESLAGCESSEPRYIVDVKPDVSPENEGEEKMRRDFVASGALEPGSRDTFGDDDNELTELVENCMSSLLDELENIGTRSSKSDLTLAIVELCRVAQGSVYDDISASIATHTGSNSKQRIAKAGLFATNAGGGPSDAYTPTAERFRLAASRVLNLYAMDRGSEGGELLCSHLVECSKEDIEMSGPRTGALSLLTIVKNTCYDCADLFGGPKFANPVPENLEDEYASLTMARQQQAFRSGLAIDVERMFAEKVVVFPHPFEITDFQRNSVVSLVLKVALKTLVEDVRFIRFSIQGYRQLLIDAEFLKFILPHYVKDEILPDGSNAHSVLEGLLAEAVKCAKERCDSSAMLDDDTSEVNKARSSVRKFMAMNGGEGGLLSRFIMTEE
jgi:hypothetical protein